MVRRAVGVDATLRGHPRPLRFRGFRDGRGEGRGGRRPRRVRVGGDADRAGSCRDAGRRRRCFSTRATNGFPAAESSAHSQFRRGLHTAFGPHWAEERGSEARPAAALGERSSGANSTSSRHHRDVTTPSLERDQRCSIEFRDREMTVVGRFHRRRGGLPSTESDQSLHANDQRRTNPVPPKPPSRIAGGFHPGWPAHGARGARWTGRLSALRIASLDRTCEHRVERIRPASVEEIAERCCVQHPVHTRHRKPDHRGTEHVLVMRMRRSTSTFQR